MMRLSGKQVAELLSEFSNCAFESEKIEFAQTVTSDHKTLQEEMFTMFLGCIKEWSEMSERQIDIRNQYTHKASKIMIQALRDNGLF